MHRLIHRLRDGWRAWERLREEIDGCRAKLAGLPDGDAWLTAHIDDLDRRQREALAVFHHRLEACQAEGLIDAEWRKTDKAKQFESQR